MVPCNIVLDRGPGRPTGRGDLGVGILSSQRCLLLPKYFGSCCSSVTCIVLVLINFDDDNNDIIQLSRKMPLAFANDRVYFKHFNNANSEKNNEIQFQKTVSRYRTNEPPNTNQLAVRKGVILRTNPSTAQNKISQQHCNTAERHSFVFTIGVIRVHTGCAKKVTPFWYLSFLPLLDALFAIFVYLHIIFIKCLISKPCVVSIQMDSVAK